MKKKKYGFKKNFIIVSAVFIIGLIFAFGSRLVHFYLEENRSIEEGTEEKTNYFNDILENTINVTDSNGGLYLDKEDYIYKYDASENYLWYSGQLWRILRINEDKTITIMTDEAITLLQASYDGNNYITSFLDDFYNKLDHDFLVSFNVCNDKVSENKNITCDEKVETNISLLDIFTYNKVGSTKSYINNETSFWINNQNEENNYFYVNEEGALVVGNEVAHNVRPVVTLKSKIVLVSGDGSLENPYVIKKSETHDFKDSIIGEYIKYNDSIWRIVDIHESSIQAIKVTCIETESEECLKYKFGNNITYLNSQLYKYLNNTYLDTFENKEFIVKEKFYNGLYTDYNYESLKESSVEAYVGLPKIADYYIQNNISSYLITPNIIDTVYTVNELGNYYLVNPITELNIYPILNFDITLNISSGDGTINNPYELSR